jgi:hypothetical protein
MFSVKAPKDNARGVKILLFAGQPGKKWRHSWDGRRHD